jgi:hypothetical protein
LKVIDPPTLVGVSLFEIVITAAFVGAATANTVAKPF